MKRKLIYQSEASNKFWNIKVEDETQTINWGKLGTKGRESIKNFESPEKCYKESNKLITQKIKKGYVDLLSKEDIPDKFDVSDERFADYFFWTAIEKSNKSKSSHWEDYDIDDHIDNLTVLLSNFDKKKLVLFEKVLQEKLNKLYLAKIAELSIILECSFKNNKGEIVFDDYISTDGFIYFRCWLLLKGEAFFKEICATINSFISGKYSFNIGDTWAEGLLYAADEAYGYYNENDELSAIRDHVNELFPAVIHYDSSENEMDRKVSGGSDLHEMYPELVNEICELRKE